MWLVEGTQAYSDAYDERFGDVDDENTIILELCIVGAEEELYENLPEDVDFSIFISCFKNFYEAFIEAYTEKYYWKLHAKHYDYVLW